MPAPATPSVNHGPLFPPGYALVPADATRRMIDAAARVEENGKRTGNTR